jgi:hypothetical protein
MYCGRAERSRYGSAEAATGLAPGRKAVRSETRPLAAAQFPRVAEPSSAALKALIRSAKTPIY